MQKVYSVREIENILHPVFAGYGVRRAVLFGSYAKGQATTRSDVDILVDSGLRGLAFFGLLEGVASTLDVPVDLIDVSQIESGSQIELEIQRTGVSIYEQ
ncbi:nucleotidyltransferase domain-containing protein [Oscillospiraceae bacterium 21-37]|uniref:nucleotidyltransferase family protein n=1 Tax=Acutalibacter sp. JLR.KK004 TaxID=3112622 RepID=UPI00216FD535|nr:nucleotidyltransferase domain-containing protein [Acutalibacter sp.]